MGLKRVVEAPTPTGITLNIQTVGACIARPHEMSINGFESGCRGANPYRHHLEYTDRRGVHRTSA